MNDCIFCKVVRGEIEHSVYWQDENSMAFLDKTPMSLGHTLLIPKTHVDYIFDVESDTYKQLFESAKKLAGPIKEVSGAKRVGIIISGFQIPHAHIHIVPLNSDHDLHNSPKMEVSEEEREGLAAKLKELLL